MQLVLFSCLVISLAHDGLCRPSELGEALVAPTIDLTSSDNNGLLPPLQSQVPASSSYRLGSRPGGLRLITDQDKDVRIIFLFDFKPIHLFPKPQYIRGKNSIRNIITKDDI
ncbi:uncharacterized protein LOC132201705 [Neocloeon triangulifer]|uniref:uncharacterized protein LOC132201705 n=1 Tax=Neocloeon triangulifer TaxID=2078957 RepID=UPI00286EEB39|nr:uncharacterized protein LOC132201705 [Neocloeon triangulifer]